MWRKGSDEESSGDRVGEEKIRRNLGFGLGSGVEMGEV